MLVVLEDLLSRRYKRDREDHTEIDFVHVTRRLMKARGHDNGDYGEHSWKWNKITSLEPTDEDWTKWNVSEGKLHVELPLRRRWVLAGQKDQQHASDDDMQEDGAEGAANADNAVDDDDVVVVEVKKSYKQIREARGGHSDDEDLTTGVHLMHYSVPASPQGKEDYGRRLCGFATPVDDL